MLPVRPRPSSEEDAIVRRPAAAHGVVVGAWAFVLTAIVLWPVTRAGYLLGHDLVFTPRQPLGLDSIGLGTAAPRAVPLDALVALAERVVDGAVVGRIALAAPLLAVGVGTALLLRTGLPGRLAACSLAIWNPYVLERLALGQWALLWCYAALPYIVLALTRQRGTVRWAVLAPALAAASVTATGGVIAAVAAVVVTAFTATGDRSRQMLRVALLALVTQLPWVVPAFVGAAAATSDPRAVAAFAARGETGGVLLSLLGGGGIWDEQAVPPSRSGPLPLLALAVLVAAAVIGGRRLAELLGTRTLAALGTLAAAGFVVASASSLPGTDAVLRAAVAHLPGGGLLRDAQKWVLPLVVDEALLVGAAVDRLATRVRTLDRRVVVGVAAAVLPVLLLPDGAAPVHATVQPVHYPGDWAAVARRLHGGGDVVVLPFASYRRFPWAPGRSSVLDPAPRLLPAPTVVDDRLSVSGVLLRGEDPRAAAVARAVASGAGLPPKLAALGIRWVVLERRTPGPLPSLAGLREIRPGLDVALYEVPGRPAPRQVLSGRLVAVLCGDVLAVVALVAVVGAGPVRRRRTRRRRPVKGTPSAGRL